MTKTTREITVRSKLQEYLKTLADRVYFQVAPENATFPYIVFDFSSVDVSGEFSEMTLVDVTAWDDALDGDSTTVENLISTVNTGLNKYVLAIDGDYAIFYLNAKVYTQDSDTRLKRRTYTYTATKYERS